MDLLRVHRKRCGLTVVLLRVQRQMVLRWFCLGPDEKAQVTMVLRRVHKTIIGFTIVLLWVQRESNGFTIVLLRLQKQSIGFTMVLLRV